MATTEEVLAHLSQDEIDYPAAAATLGPDALPILLELARRGDPAIAPKAVYLATLIEPAGTVDPGDVVRAGMASDQDVVRVAAAAGLANLTAIPGDLLALLGDADAGVRKVALRSVAANPVPEAREAVLALAETDPEPFVRDLASDVAERYG